jgi:quercetin dioxygenase-like cupin family protein
MEHWDLLTLDVEPHKPQVLHTTRDEARSIVLFLPAGEELRDHQVHERAHLIVVDGEVEIRSDGGEAVSGSTGLLAVFDPNERHEVRANSDARLLLVLAPWPGVGHPGARDG